MNKRIIVLMLFLISVTTTGCNLNPMAKKEVPQTYEEWVDKNGSSQQQNPIFNIPKINK